MRLKYVFISNYKNLNNFSINFDSESFIEVFVGKNGAGKSNFFEALIEIFRHLFEYGKDKTELEFNYAIKYEIDGAETTIEWLSSQFIINGAKRKTLGATPLPDNVLIYYSGHNDTVAKLVERYEDSFRKRIKKADFDESRRFIGIGQEYKELLLSVLLMQNHDNKARQFICQKLGIRGVAPEMQLVLRRPNFADKKLEIDGFDPKTHYWGVEGIARSFLDKLISCVKGEFNHGNIYRSRWDQYHIPINIELFQATFNEEKPADIFRQFDNLKTLGMLEGISSPLQLDNGLDVTISHFSDGQFQSVYIYSVVELFKDRNCITLLDEPDSFLHPEWQFNFLKQVFEITDTAAKNNHVMMSSHSASTITTASDSVISLFELTANGASVTKANKSDVIRSLSAGLISFSESEARLNIQHILKNTTGSVLFAEGITDEIILEIAWDKLYSSAPRKFEIQNAFDRIFLRNMFSREDLKSTFPGRVMFALFDFDEAFDDWNGLKKECDEVTDPLLGMAKQLKYKCHYALLLPVPNNDALKKQVLNAEGDPWGRGVDSHISIELLFYAEKSLLQWFGKRAASGGGEIIEFIGDKTRFARDVVPTLSANCFEVFRPMFEFIKSKCPAV